MKLSTLSKTIVATLALTFAINVTTAPKAEAGIVLYAIGRTNDDMKLEARRNFQAWGILFIVVGIFAGWHWLVLDNQENQSQLAEQLKSQWPVLADQTAVTNKIAAALSKKAAELFKADPTARSINASLPVAELDGYLSEVVVTESNSAQLNHILQTLSQ